MDTISFPCERKHVFKSNGITEIQGNKVLKWFFHSWTGNHFDYCNLLSLCMFTLRGRQEHNEAISDVISHTAVTNNAINGFSLH